MAVRQTHPANEPGAMTCAGRKALALADLCTIRPLPESVLEEAGPVLTALLRAAEAHVRASAALRLSRCSWAPREAVRVLAFDAIAIARPVIEHSLILSESDLLALAEISREHRMALARRTRLGAPVASAIARHQESPCLLALANNPGAVLPDAAAAGFALAARADESLQEALAGRSDLSPGFARALYEVACERVRDVLTRSCPDISPQRYDDICAQTGGGSDATAAALTGQLDSEGALTAEDVLRASRNGRSEIADHAIARLTGLDAADWRQALRRSPLRVCLLAARAMEMTPDQAAGLHEALAASGRAHAMTPAAFAAACNDIYQVFSRDNALKALHQMSAGGSIH